MKLRVVWTSLLVAAQAVALVSAVAAEDAKEKDGTQQVSLWIFEQRIRNAAPGIEKVITLTDAQKESLQKAYNETFSAESVQAAATKLNNKETSAAEMQEADKTLQEARAAFLKRCREEVFTPEQTKLIDQIYQAYNEARAQAQREMAANLILGFNGRLGWLLNEEQKQALGEGRAQYAAAVKAALEKRKQEQEEASEDNPAGNGG